MSSLNTSIYSNTPDTETLFTTMPFSLYLKKQLSIHHLTQAQFSEALSRYHQEVKYMDPITTSRWVNNHTTPSPYRQLLVCLFFKTNLSKFIHRHLVDYASGTRGFKQNKKRIFNFVHSAIDKKISYLWSLKHQ
ncbi:hypothetical protein L1D45_21190, partial [Photobacterium damselae]|nr:hypothetical protein [Photobacterium damselae]